MNISRSDPNFPYEEYYLLTGVSAPGSVASLYKSKTAIRNPHDITIADVTRGVMPSVVLPKILRRKIRLLRKSLNINDQDGTFIKNDPKEALDEAQREILSKLEVPDEGKKYFEYSFAALDIMDHIPLCDRVAHYDAKKTHSKSPISNAISKYEEVNDVDKDDIKGHLPSEHEVPLYFRNIDRSRVFTTTELEKKLSRANGALLDIQKQLVRAEEIYYHDTEQHGNMHKGWDVFVDGALNHLGIDQYIDSNEDDISLIQNSSAPTKRLNSDHRWFSSSCFVIENNQFRILPKINRPSNLSPSASVVLGSSPANAIDHNDCLDSNEQATVTINDLVTPDAIVFQNDDVVDESKTPRPKLTEHSTAIKSNVDCKNRKNADDSPSKFEEDPMTKNDDKSELTVSSIDRISRKRKKDDDVPDLDEKDQNNEENKKEEVAKNGRPIRSSKRRK